MAMPVGNASLYQQEEHLAIPITWPMSSLGILYVHRAPPMTIIPSCRITLRHFGLRFLGVLLITSLSAHAQTTATGPERQHGQVAEPRVVYFVGASGQFLKLELPTLSVVALW